MSIFERLKNKEEKLSFFNKVFYFFDILFLSVFLFKKIKKVIFFMIFQHEKTRILQKKKNYFISPPKSTHGDDTGGNERCNLAAK